MYFKYNKLLCTVLASAITATSAVAAFSSGGGGSGIPGSGIFVKPAEPSGETPAEVKDIPVYAGYYGTGTEGQYKIVFTAMEEIPEFVTMGATITLTNASVDSYEILTAYTNRSVTDSSSAITYSFNRSAAVINKAEQFLSLTIKNSAAAPSADIIAFTDFSIETSDGTVIKLNPVITFKEGDILPSLTEEEQKIYDSVTGILKEFPDASKLSYYKTEQDGKKAIIPISEYSERIKTIRDEYSKLSNKKNIDTVFEFYGYKPSDLDKLIRVLDAMYTSRGLIEISYLTESITADNILDKRFLLDTYDLRKNISLSGLENTAAYTELQETLTIYNEKKAILDSVLNSDTLDYENLVYSCKTQIDTVQTLSDNLYYSDYLEALTRIIDNTYDKVDKDYSGNTQTKTYLLSCLDGYKDEIKLIKNGITDMPEISVSIVTYRSSYEVTFKRSKTLAESIKAEARVVVTDEDGKEIDTGKIEFKADQTSAVISMFASDKYPANKTITITGYYTINGADFTVGSKDVVCATVASNNPALGIGKNTGGTRLPSTSASDDDNSSGGGTRFPSNEENNNKDNNNNNKPQTKDLFNDLNGYDWAIEAIEDLYYAGIVNGMEEGIFNPKGEVTREQFSKMVVQLFGIATGDTNTSFLDVDKTAWYAPYVTAALQAGYIQGQSNEYFGIGESIMRQDMATILYRALGDSGSKAELNFTDNSSIAPYAENAIAELVGLGVINGYEDGSFLPRGTATRAEAAKMIWGVYQIINK